LKFSETRLRGAYLLEPEPHGDTRGFFARTFCVNEFGACGLVTNWAQCSISFNKTKGTLRGLHYQDDPYAETKLVRCTMGSIYDVIVDLRRDSPTFRQWVGVILTAENHNALYIPAGFAHGFQTLEDNTEVFYQISQLYHAGSSKGVRWDDPAFGITWPLPPTSLSGRDAQYPDLGS
jgi:dTDP-4-dehydrorhamnose 3,5-epimerase